MGTLAGEGHGQWASPYPKDSDSPSITLYSELWYYSTRSTSKSIVLVLLKGGSQEEEQNEMKNAFI